MARDDVTRFRMMPVRLDVTSRLVPQGLLNDDGPGDVYRFEPDGTAQAAPPELFLRGLLLADPDRDLTSFTNKYGLLQVRAVLPGRRDDLLWYERGELLSSDETESGQRRGELAGDALRFSMRLMQSLVRHWLAEEREEPVEAVWSWLALGSFWDEGGRRIAADRVSPRALTYSECRTLAVATMGKLLEDLAPRVAYSLEVPPVSLAVAIAAQLLHAMEEAIPTRVCPRCGATFIRQEGRAEHGQNRTTSVTYCSRACSNAAASKAYRDRKRKEKAE